MHRVAVPLLGLDMLAIEISGQVHPHAVDLAPESPVPGVAVPDHCVAGVDVHGHGAGRVLPDHIVQAPWRTRLRGQVGGRQPLGLEVLVSGGRALKLMASRHHRESAGLAAIGRQGVVDIGDHGDRRERGRHAVAVVGMHHQRRAARPTEVAAHAR